MHTDTPRSMASIRPGECAVVTQINHSGAMLSLLTELGLTPGAEIRCTLISPHGDMVMFELRSAVLAMRVSDLEKITVT